MFTFRFRCLKAIKKSFGLCFALLALFALSTHISAQRLSENEMRAKLQEYTKEALSRCNKNVKANWDVATDVGNSEKQKKKVKFSRHFPFSLCNRNHVRSL